MNDPQSCSKFLKIDGYFENQQIPRIYLLYTPKLFAKNFVSFEIMLYLQLIAKIKWRSNECQKRKNLRSNIS